MLRGCTLVANRSVTRRASSVGRTEGSRSRTAWRNATISAVSLWPPPWPALLWQQAGHATLLKRVLRLVERRAREVERRRGGRDGLGLDFDAADHFVFDLDAVAGIEKLVCGKDGIGDLVGVPVERAIGA
jgi:hypothetical protein